MHRHTHSAQVHRAHGPGARLLSAAETKCAIRSTSGRDGRKGSYNSLVLLTHSLKRKVLVTSVAAVLFAGFYEVTIPDSRYALFPTSDEAPAPGSRLSFTATAYCKGVVTTAGVAVQNGVAAADPAVLPVGSVVQIDARVGKYSGVYSVLDTGPAVAGREIDVYMWSCHEALAFGRRPIHLTVLRYGWNPRATTVSFIDQFLKRSLPSRPFPHDAPSAAAAAELRTKN